METMGFRCGAGMTVFVYVILLAGPCAILAADKQCPDGGVGNNSVMPHEKRLLRCLMADYERDVRPALRIEDAVNVSLDMILLQIVSLDEKNRILDLNGWIHKSWKDPQLKWNPVDFGGVTYLRIPSERIWIPDIILLNNAEFSNTNVMDKLAVVKHDGTVSWVPHARFRSFCGLKMKRFPFDTQTCSLLFGSWTYDKTKVDLSIPDNGKNIIKHIWDGKEWDVTSFSVFRKEYPYSVLSNGSAQGQKYPFVQYTLEIKRVSLFYGTMLVAPVVLMAVLTMFVFLIPPDSGERMGLAVGIIISLSLQTMVIDDYVPTEIDTMPIIFMYILFDFIMVTFAIVISIAVLNFHYRDIRKGKVPNILKSILLGRLRKLLCLKAEPYNPIPAEVGFSEATEKLNYDLSARELEATAPLPKSPTMALEKVLEEIRSYLRDLAHRDRSSSAAAPPIPSHRQLVLSEWHQVAMVVDRLAFVVYLIITVLVTIAICSHG